MATHVPTPQEAQAIVEKYNQDPFHRTHALTVANVMRWYAAKYDTGNEDYWYVVGMLHDVDFELYPTEHCVAGERLLKDEGVDKGVIHSAMSHGWGMTDVTYEPESQMENILFAADELTGLIWASTLMRPSRSTLDMNLKSLKKKFKDKKFAAGCSRDTIREGAERLGWELDDLLGQTLEAMQAFERSQGGLPGVERPAEE